MTMPMSADEQSQVRKMVEDTRDATQNLLGVVNIMKSMMETRLDAIEELAGSTSLIVRGNGRDGGLRERLRIAEGEIESLDEALSRRDEVKAEVSKVRWGAVMNGAALLAAIVSLAVATLT